jgi:predicted branched-subunit amino acid permease
MAGMQLAHEPPSVLDRDDARRAAVFSGVRAIAPLVAGLVPLALTVGAAAARAGLPPLVGWASSPILYGASGQLTWMQVLGGNGPIALAIGATTLVNLQLLLYGAAMRPYWVERPRGWRIVAAQLLVSPVFAVAAPHHRAEPDPDLQAHFYLAAGLTLWVTWLVVTGVGYTLGGLASLPVLALLTPLITLTLALRGVVDAATLSALLVASTVALVAANLPYDVGSVGAGIAGIVAGIIVDSRHRRRDRTRSQEATAP